MPNNKDKTDIERILDAAREYEEYFKEPSLELENILGKLRTAQEISSKRVEELSKSGSVRGLDRYLTDQLSALTSLYEQEKNIIEDKVNIKKTAVDYAMKSKSTDTGDSSELLQKFISIAEDNRKNTEKLLEKTKVSNNTEESQEDIDDEIMNRIKESQE